MVRAIPQKQEDHQNHQHYRDDERSLGIVHRSADGDRLIHGHPHIDGLGDGSMKLRQHGADAVDRVDDIGARLPEDDDQHGRFAVGITRVA